MMEFVLASNNKKKIAELQAILSEKIPNIKILSLADIGYNGDIEETGKTFEENSLIKASVPAKMGYIGIADDSGLCVDALNGEPGIYSARYSGGNDDDNINYLLEKMKNVPNGERTARFVCCMSCAFPDGRSFSVMGTVNGTILCERQGNGGFGYDPVFYYPPYGKTFSLLSPEEKNKISHRAMAISALAKRLEELC